MLKIVFLCNLLVLSLFSGVYAQEHVVTYNSSDENFLNPERGFYRVFLTNAEKYAPLTVDELQHSREGYQPYGGAPFSMTVSLVLRQFELRGYQHKPLTDDLLQNIDADFATARKAGVKLIVRFSYYFSSTVNFQPPYNDAPLEVLLQHISQLKPILQKNKDVIATAQMGFIGLWGEGYYSDYYGRPDKATPQNVQDRATILKAFLDAVPAPLFVQVRHPSYRQQFEATVMDTRGMKRVGFYNEAFLSSADDMGTFRAYDIPGNTLARAKNTKAVLQSYMQQVSLGTVMGGESASANPPYDKCTDKGGQAQTELAKYHYSFLNAGYNEKMLSGWQPCIEDIKQHLGYRLEMKSGKYPGKIQRNTVFSISLNLNNVGYAAPYNPKDVSLLLVNDADNSVLTTMLPVDITSWAPGNISFQVKCYVGAKLPEGKYHLYLKVADKDDQLAKRPEYCVRFANKDTWNQQLAANALQTVLNITGTSTVAVNQKKLKTNKIAIIRQ